jgi:haloalkane dehalogenase
MSTPAGVPIGQRRGLRGQAPARLDPGAILVGRARELCRRLSNQRKAAVKVIHFVQEDAPTEIGIALREFLKTLS